MNHRRLLDSIEEEKTKLEHYLAQGTIHDFSAYKFITGQIRGLQAAINIYHSLSQEENNGFNRH